MELSKNFEPMAIEEKWTKHWKEHRYFNSKPDERKPFTVVIPPPNVTGVLHMGHTLNETVQDILVRKARMSGFNACWVPGSDHASIATEAKVVEMLKEKGIDKNAISREEFLQYAFEWKEKYGGIIYNQIDRLGCSVDWNRVTFTMDDNYYKAVIKVFVDLYNKGLIYRGARMINWDPAAKTALSDEEVEYKEVQGNLYYVKYVISDDGGPMADGRNAPTANEQRTTDNFITIATQRPETIMGDTAVCVNPNDERYQHLKGKKIIVPLVNRKVPIIFDDYVDPAFGTGALKVTPAHDVNDYNLGLKHNLPIVDTLNEDGTLSDAAEVFVGLDRFEARKKAIEKLRKDGLLIKEEEYTTRIGYSQRTNTVVEPRISTQWFVKMKELAEPALKEVTEDRINIHPGEKFLATYKYWLENVKDWCISRQLWWGQRIPAWYDEKGNVYVAEAETEAIDQWVIGNGQSNETSTYRLKQDQDVLDTWFSSWLWPVEVFKGITKPGNEEIKYYYPTSVLVTGQDIIFFWVARMIMAGMEYMKEKPFSDVYFTGMVRDKQGRKMSKQLGNSPDLLELIDKYGADAVRFGIMISSPAGNDLLFDEAGLEQGRNFNNKIWNALKLVRSWETRVQSSELGAGSSEPKVQRQLNVGTQQSPTHDPRLTTHDFATDWFESRLNEVRDDVENLYKNFRLSEALKTIYSLIWDDFCSWYLEWAKPGFEQPVDETVYNKTIDFFEQLLQLLHPFMPFITEEIYHRLKNQLDDLVIKQYPAYEAVDKNILQNGLLLKETITAIRDARNKNQIKPKETIRLHIQTDTPENYKPIEAILLKQVNAENAGYTNKAVSNTIAIVVQKDKFYIETAAELNTTSQKEQLLKELNYHKGFLASVEKKLSNERFIQNAKMEVVEFEQKKKADAEAKIKAIEESLEAL
jgi:valyl-tRNA synthetase